MESSGALGPEEIGRRGQVGGVAADGFQDEGDGRRTLQLEHELRSDWELREAGKDRWTVGGINVANK